MNETHGVGLGDRPVRIVGLCGSLRRGSYNRSALRAAVELCPAGLIVDVEPIDDLPSYNQDLEDAGAPAPVKRLARAIAAADGLLVATPEYNYSIPGILKNAIDWMSRAPGQPLSGKPLAIMGASTGSVGTARAQLHLRQIAIYVNMLALNKPEVLISHAQDKVGADGALAAAGTRAIIGQLLANLQDTALLIRGRGDVSAAPAAAGPTAIETEPPRR